MRYFFLFFFATNIFALNWTPVTSNNEAISYVDIDSIKKSNGMVYYWNLSDRYEKVTIGDITFMSTVSYNMTDCDDINRVKILSTSFYEGKMAGGRSLYTVEGQDWSYNVPGSVGASLDNYVCSIIK